MSATLQAFLRSSCRGLGVDPRYLNSPEAADDPLTALLQEAIALREDQRAELSLQVLEIAIAAGLSSEWIDDNRARALLALERNDEAQQLLQKLLNSPTEAIAEAARSQLEALGHGPEPAAENPPTDPMPMESADGVETSQVFETSAGDPPELIALLEQAIDLREQGQAEASLELLEQAEADGFSSPWLQDNRARALVHLGRRYEAIALWQELEDSDDSDLAAMVGPLALEQGRELVAELQAQLGPVAAEHGISQTWRSQADLKPASLQDAMLKEALSLREGGRAAASLALLDGAAKAGLPSGWLQDNRARALVHLERQVEAVTLWRQLLPNDDALLDQTARQMLELYERDANRQETMNQADALLRSHEPDEAIRLLTVAILNDPEWDDWREGLQRAVALKDSDASAASDGLLAQELRQPKRVLQAFDAFLSAMEQRLAAQR